MPCEAAVLLPENKRAPAPENWQSAVLSDSALQLLLRQKTGISPKEVVEELFTYGRYHGGMVILLDRLRTAKSRLYVASMGFDDKACEPGYPLAGPLFRAIRKEIRKFAKIRLVPSQEYYNTPVLASREILAQCTKQGYVLMSQLGQVELSAPVDSDN